MRKAISYGDACDDLRIADFGGEAWLRSARSSSIGAAVGAGNARRIVEIQDGIGAGAE